MFWSRLFFFVEGRIVDPTKVLEQVQSRASQADVFDSVRVEPGRIECRARGCESDAYFRVEPEGSKWWVSFVTPDRWLSESIEADLQHTGDDLEELLEEELAEFDIEGKVTFEHFRSEDRLFTFRTPVAIERGGEARAAGDVLAGYLLAYEACFRELGDVAGAREEG